MVGVWDGRATAFLWPSAAAAAVSSTGVCVVTPAVSWTGVCAVLVVPVRDGVVWTGREGVAWTSDGGVLWPESAGYEQK